MSESNSSTIVHELPAFRPASNTKVNAWNKLRSYLHVLGVSLAVENPLMWSRLRGHHPRADLAGPYYITGAPIRAIGDGKVVMASGHELKEFTPFLLSMTVKDPQGTPVKNAQVDWWQADTAGVYRHSTYGLRGKFTTDDEGRAEVLTVLPGAYGPAGNVRAGHFHAIITPPGRRAQELTTQMYVCRANDAAELQSDLLNRYRQPRPANVLQAWSISSGNGKFMDLPELSPDDSETKAKVESWNAMLATFDPSLKIVAGAQTELQLSSRSRISGL